VIVDAWQEYPRPPGGAGVCVGMSRNGEEGDKGVNNFEADDIDDGDGGDDNNCDGNRAPLLLQTLSVNNGATNTLSKPSIFFCAANRIAASNHPMTMIRAVTGIAVL